MFKMIIELDEKRMIRDGLDVETAWKQIEEMIAETKVVHMDEKGIIYTDNSGAAMYLQELFEDTEWFMKYVCKYLVNYMGDIYEDAIEAYREEGVRICYE